MCPLPPLLAGEVGEQTLLQEPDGKGARSPLVHRHLAEGGVESLGDGPDGVHHVASLDGLAGVGRGLGGRHLGRGELQRLSGPSRRDRRRVDSAEWVLRGEERPQVVVAILPERRRRCDHPQLVGVVVQPELP